MRKVPFPQANSLQRIYDIFASLDNSGVLKFEVMEEYKLTEREAAYYLDALEYIGLVDKYKMRYFLNEKGYLVRDFPETRLKFAEVILEDEFLSELYSDRFHFPDRKGFQNYLAGKISEKHSLKFVTSMRRASTIMSWFSWIDNLQHKRDCNE